MSEMSAHGKKISETKRKRFEEWVESVYDHSDSIYKKIPLSNKEGLYATVDSKNYDWLIWLGRWLLNSRGYVIANIRQENGNYKQLYMHRLVMSCSDDMEVDHRYQDKLDNREDSLRICTRMQNARNIAPFASKKKSVYKGVSYHKDRKVWYSRIVVNNKTIQLGSFSNEIACANCYNYYANIYYGDYAYINEVEYMEKQEWESYRLKPNRMTKLDNQIII